MQYKSVKGFTGWGQLGVLCAFTGMGFVLAAFIQSYFMDKALGPTTLPFDEKIEAGMKALMQPGNENYAQLAQIFGTLVLMFIPSLAYILICHKRFFWAGFNKHFTVVQIVIAFFLILIANYFAVPFEQITKSVLSHFPSWDKLAKAAEDLYTQAIGSMSSLKTGSQFFVAIFIIAFLPALFEELFFRGVVQNLFVRWWKKPLLAIIVTSILFSLIHASYYLFLSRLVLGFVLGMLFYYSKNIWINVFAHFANNLLALAALFYANTHPAAQTNLTEIDKQIPIWSLPITGAILIGLFILYKKHSKAGSEAVTTKENILLAEANPFAAYE
jgi:uncharacterized protein